MKNILFLLLFISVVGYSQQSTVYTRYTGVISDTLNIPQVNGIVYWNPITGYLMYREGNTWKKVSTAGSGGISGLTAARIPFAATSTTLGDDSNLIWNNTLKNLGVGGVATHQLTVRATSNNKNVFLVEDDAGNDAISVAEVGSVLNTVISGTNLTLNPTGNLVSGKKHSFTPDATYAGLNLGQYTDHPSNPDLGDVYYNTTVDSLYFYLNGAWEALQGNLRGTLSVSRIPFAIGVHALGDDSQLGWDNSLKSLGIGQTGGGNSQLTIQSTSANRSMFNVRENDSGGAPTPFEISEISDLTRIRLEADSVLLNSAIVNIPNAPSDDTADDILARDSDGNLVYRDASTIGGGTGTVTEVSTSGPSEGFTAVVTNETTTPNIDFDLTDDLLAIESLSSTGFPVRTSTSTWVQRTLSAGTGISIANGNGVSGNPTISVTTGAYWPLSGSATLTGNNTISGGGFDLSLGTSGSNIDDFAVYPTTGLISIPGASSGERFAIKFAAGNENHGLVYEGSGFGTILPSFGVYNLVSGVRSVIRPSNGIELYSTDGGGSSVIFNIQDVESSAGARFIDNRTTKRGIEYNASGYVTQTRSLTDKGYVDGNLIGKTLPSAPTVTEDGQALRWSNGSNAFEFFTPASGTGTVESVGLSTGTTGTDVSVSGSPVTTSGTITLNIPTASGTNTGKLSSTDWTTFNSKQAALVSGTNIKTVNSTSLLGSGNLAVGTVTSVGMTDITGLTFSGDPITSSGNITPALANDLAALEGMSGTGIVTRTASETYAQRTITAGNGISITNGDGVSGNPTISLAGGAENNYTEFSLSSADILSLGGASTGDGITVVAAPGAGKYIKVISAIAYLDHNGSDYANASQTKLGYDTGSVILSQGFNDTNINQNADFIFEHLENATVIAWAASAVINKPLVFHCIGTPTDGNGTLKLYIHYQIVTL